MFRWLRRKNRNAGSRPVRSRRARLMVQGLEGRVVPTTFTVTNADDAGAGSLRQAILDSNAAAGTDAVAFDPGFFATPRTITLTSGQLTIADALTVNGPGPNLLTVSGGGVTRVFNIDDGAFVATAATLAGLTVTGGNGTNGAGVAGDGGGIFTHERLTLDNVVVTGNTSGVNDGGGIGVIGREFVTIRNSTLSGNSARIGGGIYFFAEGSLLVENSTISGNIASSTAGGIYFWGNVSGGGFTIRNSTIAGNTSTSGGGLFINNQNGTALIQNSTITGNTATATSTNTGIGGGGISINPTTTGANPVLSLVSTIVSGNAAANGFSDIAADPGTTVNVNFSAIGDPDGFTPSATSGNNLPFGAALNLLPLSGNGGPTLTVPLGLGSAAVNAGSNPAALTTDQRGPGFPRILAGAADIGAYEGTVDTPGASASLANVTTGGGATYTFTVTYSGQTPIDVATLDNNDVRVTGPNGYDQLATFVSVNPPGNGTPRTATYSIPAPGGTFGGEDYGTYAVALQANQVANTNGGTAPAGALGTFKVLIPQTFTVTNLNDSGAGSLRQALTDANATAGTADFVVFQAGLTGTITLTSTLNITDSLTIAGPGAASLTISGGDAVRVLKAFTDLAISGLTISGGRTSFAPEFFGGAGILASRLTLDGVVVSGNTMTGNGPGGGIRAGSLTVRNSTITGNVCGSVGPTYGGGGGGINVNSLVMENCTVVGNTANGAGGGGGIYLSPNGTNSVTIRNSTIAGNTAPSGGGISAGGSATTIQNCTITGNTSTATGTAAGVGGGGIRGGVNLVSTIVSGNTSANGRDDIAASATAVVNANFSAVGDLDGFTPSATSANNLFGATLNLQPLADNGGPTQTVALGAGSAAVNAGTNPAGLATDQRGAGFTRVQAGAADIGAFESAFDQPTGGAAPFADIVTPGGTTYTVTVTYNGYSAPIDVATLDNADIRVTGPNGFDQLATLVGVDPSGNGTPRTATYSFTAPGGTFDVTDNGTYAIALQANQVATTGAVFVPAATYGTFRVTVGQAFAVTNLNDAGPGSLRQALADADATAGVADFVVFQAGLTGTIALASTLTIADGVTITGPGAANLALSGGGAVRVLNINNPTAAITVAISGVTIAGGNVAGDGGGINFGDETLTLDGVAITGNTVTVPNSTSGNGGGIAGSSGSLTVRNSTISGNAAGAAPSPYSANGGGIFLRNGSLLLENSTVFGNTANSTFTGGGGVCVFGTTTAAGVTIRNCTITGNTALNGGGAMLAGNFWPAPTAIQNSTITANRSTATGTTAGEGGGGIAVQGFQQGPLCVVNIASTIVSGNASANGRDDIAAALRAAMNVNFSAVGDADGFTPSATSGNNLAAGTDLFLLPLADNGGPTRTFALGLGSAAVDAGSNPAGLATDQRGPGFPRVLGGAADIGAFEGTVDAPSVSAGPLTDVTAPATTYTITLTISGTTPIDVATLDNNDIRVTGPNGFDQLATFVSVNPPGNGSPRTATYSVPAPGGTFGSEDNGTYAVALQPGQVANTNGGTAPGTALGTFRVVIPQTFTVTNLDDDGPGSLRQAIADANATVGLADTIVFQAGLTGTIALADTLTITDPVTIAGPGAANVALDGGGAVQVLLIDDGDTNSHIDVAISGLTVTHGFDTGFGGGGIYCTDETLTLDRVVISGNESAGFGGGLSGGLYPSLTVRDCTISGNTAGGGGGGLYTFGGTLVVENSTITGNTAGFGGGGLGFYAAGLFGRFPGAIIRNCTIAGNTAPSGGGIAIRGDALAASPVLIQNSTITGNTATSTDPTGGYGYGGGGLSLYYVYTTNFVHIASSVISGNTSANGSDDISAAAAATVDLNFSAVGDADGFTPSPTSGDNLPFGTVLGLGTLANNGGPTQTISIAANSPLRNAGSNPAGVVNDQRGPGFPRSSGGGVDIGAFEFQVAPQVSDVTVNAGQANATQRSRVTSIDITFDTVVTFAGAVADAFTLSRIGGGAVGGFTAVANVVNGVTVVTLSGFTGTETEFGSLADGRYSVLVRANQVSSGGLQLDGDGNGTGGDDYALNGTAANGLYRLYGDVSGDGVCNALDYGLFRPAFGSSVGQSAYLDFLDIDGDGFINAFDLGEFRTRYGSSVP